MINSTTEYYHILKSDQILYLLLVFRAKLIVPRIVEISFQNNMWVTAGDGQYYEKFALDNARLTPHPKLLLHSQTETYNELRE
jgi:hypothetical protein